MLIDLFFSFLFFVFIQELFRWETISKSGTAIMFLGGFSSRICQHVCQGNPKGLSQRSHLFRRQGQQCSPLKGTMERSTRISWGSCCTILRCSPMTKQPWGLLSAAGLACTVYFGRTFNPAQPSSLSAYVCPSSSYLPPPSFQLSISHHVFPLPLADSNGYECGPQLCERLPREDFCVLCLYFLPLTTVDTSQTVPR